jgi:hypothetical protein
MRRQRVLSAAGGLAVLGAMIAVNELVVRALFDESYLSLYLSYGALTSLVVVVFTLAWSDELEQHTSLVSAHPLQYAAGYVGVGVALGQAGSALLAPGRKQFAEGLAAQARLRATTAELQANVRALAANPRAAGKFGGPIAQIADNLEQSKSTQRELPQIPIGLGIVDALLSVVLFLGLLLAFVAWILLVVPAQYFVCLIAGAPARAAIASPQRAWVRVTREEIQVVEDSKHQDIPEGATESGYSAKPVTLTASLAAVLLFAASQLAG